MVPAHLVVLPELPRTRHGKVDRQALPPPDLSRAGRPWDRAEPRTPVERQLADIWEAVLGIAPVGLHDNFFHLGGHSLHAIQAISRIREAFRVELPLRRLVDQPTVAAVALEIVQLRAERAGEEDLARLLLEIEELSEEQTRALLE